MKRALIIHGWGANPGMHWFPEEIGYLRSLGYQVEAPSMPNKHNPRENDWLKVVEEFAPDEQSILIGHSLGGTTVLEYLEKHSGKKVDRVLLLATPIRFSEKLKLSSPHSFKLFAEEVATECFLGLCEYEEIFDWEKIRNSANNISLIYKHDDLRVPPEEGQFLASKLGVEVQILEGKDHCDYIDIETINKSLNLEIE